MSHKLHHGLCQVYQTLCDTFCKENMVKSISMKMAKPLIKLHVKPILASVLLTWQNSLSRQQHHVALQVFGFDVCTFVHRIPVADLITSEYVWERSPGEGAHGKEPKRPW